MVDPIENSNTDERRASGPSITSNESTVRQTIVANLEAPKLQGVSTKHFSSFLQLREAYERDVEEKNKEPGMKITPTSYKASVDRVHLKIFVTAGWVESTEVDKITEEEIKDCIKKRAVREASGAEIRRIEAAISDVKMDMKIIEPEDRVWNLQLHYENVLEGAGYANLPEKKPQTAIGHILKRIKPQALKNRMHDIVKFEKDDAQGSNKSMDFKTFMRELARQAVKMDDELLSSGSHPLQSGGNTDGGNDKPKKHQHKSKPGSSSWHASQQTKGKSVKRKRDDSDAPPCLNTAKCPNANHCMNDCLNSTPEEKKELLKQFRMKKKQKSNGEVKTLVIDRKTDRSTLFSASFLSDAVETIIMADQGSDCNLLSPDVYASIEQSDSTINATTLSPAASFSGVGNSKITCNKKVTLDVHLRIRHGNKLIMRNVEWFVSEQTVTNSLLGHPLLDAIGCNNRKMIQAACDEHNGEIDIADLMSKIDIDDKDEQHLGSIATLIYGDTFHSAGGVEEDGLEEDDIYIEMGEDKPEEVENELEKRIQEAKDKGLSARGESRLRKLLQKFKSVFRIRLGKSPPAKVKPMEVNLDSKKRPVKSKVTRYTKEQRLFLNKYVEKLVEMGFFILNRNASWQAAPHLVPKPNSCTPFRVTIDLRPLNAATEKIQWPMPDLESELQDFSGSNCFTVMDFCSSYWQLPLDPNSYDACGVVCPQGTFSSTRVLMGLTNAVAYFQSTIEPLFAELRPNVKAWIDDFNLHDTNEDELLNKIDKFLYICAEHNLFLSAKKCVFYTDTIKWCGRIIDSEGYRLDPRNAEALKDICEPQAADELCEFIHCCRWMSVAIPDFSRRISPLNDILENAYRKSGKRTKKSIKSIQLRNVGWKDIHTSTFRDIQKNLQDSVKLAHPKEGKVICVHTDASNRHWAAVVTQTDPDDLKKPLNAQSHEPLAFLGGEFTNSSRNWTTFEKEGFAIFKVFDKLDYMMASTQDVHIFTDHRNLLFAFAPTVFDPAIGRHVISKVQLWAMYLSRFKFSIEHIDGAKNIFADILTRWTRGYRSENLETSHICALINTEQLVPTASETEWPTITVIRHSQLQSESAPLDSSEKDGVLHLNRKIWVPNEDADLKLRILVISHCGARGHRGKAATESLIREKFIWDDLEKDVSTFVDSCLHCIISRSGDKIPRPLANTLHGTRPNEVLHMDYLFMGESIERELSYVLIIKDDFSSFVWLYPTTSATSDAAADALSTWVATFGGFDWIVSDQGAHFKNKLISNLVEILKFSHHFTPAYSPQSNGTVERVCKEVIRACKALLLEFKMKPTDWPAVIEIVQSILNHSPLERLGARSTSDPRIFRTPLEVFTTHIPKQPLLHPLPFEEFQHVDSISEVRCKQLINIEKTQNELEKMHRDVALKFDKRREKSRSYHNAETKVSDVIFNEGDFVDVRTKKKRAHKLSFTWVGPKRISKAISDSVYEVKDLQNRKVEVAHAQRLKLYRANLEGKEVEPKLLNYSLHSEATFQTLSKIRDIKKSEESYHVQVEWMGLPDNSDFTWEPIHQVFDDAPGILQDFLHSAGNRTIKKQAHKLFYE